MLAWFVVITLIASLCSAGMGLAWLLGLRNLRRLWLVSASIGAAAAMFISWFGGGAGDQILIGAGYGAATGSVVWLILWSGVRPFLRAIETDHSREKR